MTFREFQSRAPLYVLGALRPEELDQFEQAKRQLGPVAKAWLNECYALRDAFALSVRPKIAREAMTYRLMAMIRKRAAGTV
jgi:hypothetical protein